MKFVIVLSKPIDLELQEATVKVGNLLPTDAAKLLLLNTPLEKIHPMGFRSVNGLKECDLFKKYSNQISIQTLWWISQRLLQGQKFDRIQAEFIEKLETMKNNEDNSKVLVENTIKYLYFNFLILNSFFSLVKSKKVILKVFSSFYESRVIHQE